MPPPDIRRLTRKLVSVLCRRKSDEQEVEEGGDGGGGDGGKAKLSRCLGTVDLVALGVGSTLGAGVYVIAGEVAQKTSGPAVVVSFFVAAAASVLAGLCYAEFGARVPKSGSAYAYSYVSVGELMAFVIGWNLILEYMIGAASVARAWSQNLDSLAGGRIIGAFRATMPIYLKGLAEYPDFMAFAIILVLTVVISLGVKESAWVTKVFTLVNLVVLSMIFLAGLWLANFENWTVQPGVNGTVEYANITFSAESVGNGGFLPFGWRSIVSGAGTCFYAFIGFDAIATTGEEVKNPQRSIPLGIILSLTICFLAYFSLSAVLTLMLPYFALDPLAPLPSAFSAHGWSITNYLIAVGAVCALSTSLLGSMIPLPRIVYAMAEDGLIFRFLARVNPRLATPLTATLITGCMAALMSCLVELKELVDMMSIGTLLAYTLVAVSVLILRGSRDGQGNAASSSGTRPENDNDQPAAEAEAESSSDGNITGVVSSQTAMLSVSTSVGINSDSNRQRGSRSRQRNHHRRSQRSIGQRLCDYLRRAFPRRADDGAGRHQLPTADTEAVTRVMAGLFLAFAACLGFCLEQASSRRHATAFLAAAGLLWLPLCSLCCASLFLQPQSSRMLAFRVPWVPFLPCASIGINLYLMMALSGGTWLRFLVWMAVGFLIYFAYGVWHSSERRKQQQRQRQQHGSAASGRRGRTAAS